jgi:hypothetical protein
LKSLLSQYIQINHELIIPPTRLMESNSWEREGDKG